MEVQGERYLLLMVCMHILCLLPARHALQAPLSGVRAALACLAAAVYSLLSLLPGLPLQRPAAAFFALLVCSVTAFGRRFARAAFYQGKAGLCYAGLCALLERQGVGASGCLAGCALMCALMCRQGKAAKKAVLRVHWKGKSCSLSCLHDTGNALRHPVFGLPVIVAGENQLRPLLPADFSRENLPAGFSLLPVKTVQGKGLLPCFCPEKIVPDGGGDALCAWIALTPEKMPYALLPRDMQLKEERRWRKSVRSGKRKTPSVPG